MYSQQSAAEYGTIKQGEIVESETKIKIVTGVFDLLAVVVASGLAPFLIWLFAIIGAALLLAIILGPDDFVEVLAWILGTIVVLALIVLIAFAGLGYIILHLFHLL